MAVLGSDNITHSTDFNFIVGASGNTQLTIKNSGQIIRGSSDTIQVSNVIPGLQLVGTTQNLFANLNITRFGNDNVGPALTFGKGRSGTVSIGNAALNGDVVGGIDWYVDNGTNMTSRAANIECALTANATATNSSGELIFRTTSPNSTLTTGKFFIRSNGKIQAQNCEHWVSALSPSSESGVIENGSNANGLFTRYADGTLICAHIATSTNSGGFATTTLPATYINSNYIITLGTFTDVPRYAICTNRGTTSFQHQSYAEGPGRSQLSSLYMTFGRWF
jgi:hypothetical protein